MNCRYVARPFAMIGARSSRSIVVAFSLAECPSSRARSRQSKFANAQSRSNPHILNRHRSTAELRIVGIETRNTESLTEEPCSESNDLAMSRLRIRETIISPCVGLAPSLNVCTRNSQTCLYTSKYVVLQSRSTYDLPG